MTRFQGRYRIESARLRGWDYSGPAWYFVTFCTHRRARVLGDVRDGRVRLSTAGRVVAEEWCRTPRVRPGVVLDAWVVMPDHVHGILRILPRGDARDGVPGEAGPVETPRRGVSTGAAPAREVGDAHPRLRSGSVGAVIGQFKSICTKRIRAAGDDRFGWQPRFYDRILRDADELRRVRRYIANNPIRWERDRNRSEGLLM